jgi:hypothetical protein
LIETTTTTSTYFNLNVYNVFLQEGDEVTRGGGAAAKDESPCGINAVDV